MSRRFRQTGTEVGVISLATKTCDQCGVERSDDVVGWFVIERDLIRIGEADQLDFCSVDCLENYVVSGRLRPKQVRT